MVRSRHIQIAILQMHILTIFDILPSGEVFFMNNRSYKPRSTRQTVRDFVSKYNILVKDIFML